MINPVSLQKLSQTKALQTAQTLQKSAPVSNNSINSLMGYGACASLAPVSFKGSEEVNLNGVIFNSASNEFVIPNILDLEEDVHVPTSVMREKKVAKDNTSTLGVHVATTLEDGKEITKVTNDDGKLIFAAKFNEGMAQKPTLQYRQGKFEPEVAITDDQIDGTEIKMFAGSEIKAKEFELVMPGKYKNYSTGESNNISFTGNVVVTTLCKEPKTLNAVELYNNSDLASKTTDGAYREFMQEQDPTIVIPAGGFGTRFHNLTGNVENKPSYMLPTSDNYRIMATALNMAAAGGIIDGENPENTKLTYLSQAGEIEGENVVQVPKHNSDGGAIYEGLVNGSIRPDKDVIVLNGDIISNADITRAYKKLKEDPDTALVIPFYPVDAKRAKSFGLIGIEQQEDGNSKIVEFVEKTPYTDVVPRREDFETVEEFEKAFKQYEKAQTALNPNGDGTFLINPGVYVMSDKANKVLMDLGDEEALTGENKTLLGRDVMPEIVRRCSDPNCPEEEWLINPETGNRMKVYTLPLQRADGENAFWDDIGSAEAYLNTIREIAAETDRVDTGIENKFYGMPEFLLNDFYNNTNLENSCVFLSEEHLDKAEALGERWEMEEARGNIFVANSSN